MFYAGGGLACFGGRLSDPLRQSLPNIQLALSIYTSYHQDGHLEGGPDWPLKEGKEGTVFPPKS